MRATGSVRCHIRIVNFSIHYPNMTAVRTRVLVGMSTLNYSFPGCFFLRFLFIGTRWTMLEG